MHLSLLGINHETAPVDLRERVAFAPETMADALRDARQALKTDEVVILSTCNRTEIYAALEPEHARMLRWLSDYKGAPMESLVPCTYDYRGNEAIAHMMRVASGLDSLVLGEPQILGQVKSAFTVAREADSVGSLLNNAFQHVFAIAKRVRTETAIGQNPVSVAYAAVNLSQQIFANLHEVRALLIGAGETIELVAQHLKQKNVGSIT
ncbi:MAG TPA: glutamyl-tRNA reductase, partial [Porticoccaceae bacterium]